MSFHLRWSIGTTIVESEGNGGVDFFFCFVATGRSVPVSTSSQWTDFPFSSGSSSTYLFIPLLITIQDCDPWFFMESTLISIPYWYRWYVTLTSNTGPIFVILWIHPDVYSRHDPACSNPVKSMSWIVMKYCPREIFLIKPASSPALLTRMSSGRFSNLLFVPEHWSNEDSLRLTWRWERYETPTRHSYSPQVSPNCKTNDLRSAEQVLRTNPILVRRHWADWRKWSCETTTLLSSNHCCSESIIFLLLLCFLKDPRSNALVARNIGCPLSLRWSIIISAELFHKPSGLWVCVPYHALLFLVSGMTTVQLNVFLRTPWLLHGPNTHFFVSISCPIEVAAHRREDGSIFELFRMNSVFHRRLVFLKWLLWRGTWENCPLELNWFVRQYQPVHDIQESRLLLIEDVHVFFCQDKAPNQSKRVPFAFDSLTAPSCSKVVFAHWNVFHSIADILFLIQDQFLWNTQQLLDIFDVRILCCAQILLVILSKVFCRFHSLWHKIYPTSSRWRRCQA